MPIEPPPTNISEFNYIWRNWLNRLFNQSVENQQVNFYHGRVPASGSPLGGNSGFTSSKVSTGRYKVTHNLGNSNYTLTFGPLATTGQSSANMLTQNTTYFEVKVTDLAGTLADDGVYFMLIPD
ncbi:MAG: hypothetical protein GY928_08435 [Colwellia sp.]|nr:hypothetical protein [Colwellia sp.]